MSQTKQSNTILIGRQPLLNKMQALNMDWSVGETLYQCMWIQNAVPYTIIECKNDRDPDLDPAAIATTDPQSQSPAPYTPKPNFFTERTAPFLSEIMQGPLKVAMFRGQWIELYNPTDTTVDLSTYSLHSQNDTGISFNKDHNIPPKSTFLMATRKNKTANGGLPSVDYVYNHAILKILRNDWIELRNGTEVVDRWEVNRKEFRKGYSLQRNEDGTVCHPTQPYGDGDFGSPKTIHSCP